MLQYSHALDFFFLKNSMRLYFCILNWEDRRFIVTIIVIPVFPSLFYHCVLSRKTTTLVPTITLCIKAVINIENNCPLNLDKFYL